MDLPRFNHSGMDAPLPPGGFDPLPAADSVLQQFWLMPRPDAAAAESLGFWRRFYDLPRQFVTSAGGATIMAPTRVQPTVPPASGTTARAGVARREMGQAWSGGYITPRDGRMFTAIRGTWRVPTVRLPEGAALPTSIQSMPDDTIVRCCSTWIGLDGARSYLHSTLPQVGTAQQLVVRSGGLVARYSAWWEWWCAGYITQPFTIPLDIQAGDEIMCALIVDSPTQVTFHIKNQTTGQIHVPIRVAAPNIPVAGVVPPTNPPVTSGAHLASVQRRVSGATAEWITERPSDPTSGKRYAFPDYGEVLFGDCIATAETAPGAGTALEQGLRGVTLRTLIDRRSDRIARLSVAELQELPTRGIVTRYAGP